MSTLSGPVELFLLCLTLRSMYHMCFVLCCYFCVLFYVLCSGSTLHVTCILPFGIFCYSLFWCVLCGCIILRIHVTSSILGERISVIILTQQRKQWLSVELNRWRSERIHCYFF